MKYQELDSQLTGRFAQQRKLANNTHALRKDDGTIAIRLHATDIITFHPDGTIVANSGGWKTRTTKDRLNSYLPVRINQNKGQWYWAEGKLFTDGDKILPDGKVAAQANPADEKAALDLRKRINKYAQLCVEKLPLPRPGPGDCWYCCLVDKAGQPWGEASHSTDHLISHMEEGYVVPSLVYHALNHAKVGPLVITAAFDAEGSAYFKDIATNYVPRAVRRYLTSQFNQAK
jgi:hypothetical protein